MCQNIHLIARRQLICRHLKDEAADAVSCVTAKREIFRERCQKSDKTDGSLGLFKTGRQLNSSNIEDFLFYGLQFNILQAQPTDIGQSAHLLFPITIDHRKLIRILNSHKQTNK